ncbi:unnamed protein product [Vicia faba]|uniref:Uncharacterized protein n=1 Tax=Vicia faba TaxID=3906 RepID=A0AAV0YRU2_VICFA|nr:unnamed protein product [Vicia faba]
MKLNIKWHVGVDTLPALHHLAKFTVYTPIEDVCEILQELIPYSENRKVVKIEYRSPSVDKYEKLVFINRKLKNEDDLQVMWNTFTSFEEKVLIELDTTITRSVNDIIIMLQRPPRR